MSKIKCQSCGENTCQDGYIIGSCCYITAVLLFGIPLEIGEEELRLLQEINRVARLSCLKMAKEYSNRRDEFTVEKMKEIANMVGETEGIGETIKKYQESR